MLCVVQQFVAVTKVYNNVPYILLSNLIAPYPADLGFNAMGTN